MFGKPGALGEAMGVVLFVWVWCLYTCVSTLPCQSTKLRFQLPGGLWHERGTWSWHITLFWKCKRKCLEKDRYSGSELVKRSTAQGGYSNWRCCTWLCGFTGCAVCNLWAHSPSVWSHFHFDLLSAPIKGCHQCLCPCLLSTSLMLTPRTCVATDAVFWMCCLATELGEGTIMSERSLTA